MSQANSGEGFVRMREQIWGRIGDFEALFRCCQRCRMPEKARVAPSGARE